MYKCLLFLLSFFLLTAISSFGQKIDYVMGQTSAKYILKKEKAKAADFKRVGKASVCMQYRAEKDGDDLVEVGILVRNMKLSQERGDYWVCYMMVDEVFDHAEIRYLNRQKEKIKKVLVGRGLVLLDGVYVDTELMYSHELVQVKGLTVERVKTVTMDSFNEGEKSKIISKQKELIRKRKLAKYRMERAQAAKGHVAGGKKKQSNIRQQTDAFNEKIKEGHGGPKNALLSLAVPGLGNWYVNRGRGSLIGRGVSPLATTITTYSCLGVGVFSYLQTRNYHDEYRTVEDVQAKNEAYDKAKIYSRVSMATLTAAAVLWIGDVAWTYARGRDNNRYKSYMRKKLGIAFIPTPESGNIYLTYRF